jgi:hypothetical protein
VLTHHPGDPLVVDPLAGRDAVVELRSRPWSPDRVVVGVDGPDLLGDLGVGGCPRFPGRRALDPRVVGRALDLDELTQPLHLVWTLT